jgi:hypothetical protein
MQRTDLHIERSMKLKEEFEEGERSLTRDEAILQTIQDRRWKEVRPRREMKR